MRSALHVTHASRATSTTTLKREYLRIVDELWMALRAGTTLERIPKRHSATSRFIPDRGILFFMPAHIESVGLPHQLADRLDAPDNRALSVAEILKSAGATGIR